ncbi:patatin-like phospholipase family protein [Nocardia cyriacigeorgica]|uniref:patatin-like phospholipase family protein n=1 Tax=Nocardia cyriacigeorgica TaxID=135487 RepID=UPI001893D08C|nr:patatin-like phospholipase family protein [Nocardia cyriacigeorgica]MBF6412554.1 patatin-like phospholipase family protein [Nocardia cyriacigeorgica]
MSDAAERDRIALVLGGGGPVGISWLVGLGTGLREAGIDLGQADRFVGTSAGAVVGSVLAGDGELSRLLAAERSDSAPVRHDMTVMMEIAGLIGARGQDPVRMRQRIGELALTASTGEPDEHIERIGSLVGFADWPDADLVITAIDTGTGELRPWTRDDVATLPQALASSTAVPGLFPPIPIDGRHYFDGGYRSSINADLAAGADVVVIMEPLAHVYPRSRADREHGCAREISIVPDTGAIEAFGVDLFSSSALRPAYEAGVRQAAEAAAQLKEVWPNR